MVQMSSFYFKTNKKETTNQIIKVLKTHFSELEVSEYEVKSSHDLDISWEKHEKIFLEIYKALPIYDFDYLSINEYYNDEREYHEHVVVRNSQMQRYVQNEKYFDDSYNKLYFKLNHHEITEEVYDDDSWQLDEEMCPECGEYIKKHPNVTFAYCPFCHHVEVFEEKQELEEETTNAKWKTYDFEIPLGIELPTLLVSTGQDWLSDCEEDSVFGLNPACYETANKYNAALRLCRVCAGWYHFDSDEERDKQLECYREVIKASKGEAMSYFNVWQNTFEWLNAIRENNPKYQDKLLDVSDLWDLFNRLHQRSIIEKAECFDWLIDFFKDSLKFENRYRLSDIYVQNYYDNHMEMILYLFPHQIDILTKSVAKVSSHSLATLAKNAAGLIRMGKREIGLSLYKKVFAMVWSDKASTVDEKKNVVDQFIERLAMGYENEPYIDQEIATLLEKQCTKYSDGAWSSKIRMNLGKEKR